jgi:hypothetical protein
MDDEERPQGRPMSDLKFFSLFALLSLGAMTLILGLIELLERL